MVDLTNEDTEDHAPFKTKLQKTHNGKMRLQATQQQQATTKTHNLHGYPNPFQGNTISWKLSETILYNPNDAAIKQPHTSQTPPTFSGKTNLFSLKFPSALLPTPLQATTSQNQSLPHHIQPNNPMLQPFNSITHQTQTGTMTNPFQLFPSHTPQITKTPELSETNRHYKKSKPRPHHGGQNRGRGRGRHTLGKLIKPS
jgi:hypothetical protein